MSSNDSKWSQNSPVSLNEPKAKIGLNKPEWAQKTLNIFKMILYDRKIGQNRHCTASATEVTSNALAFT